MKIHGIKLRNVRRFKELSLDLPGALTLIGGPNGAGKTTLQQTILAAMFFCEKQVRDSFVSQFDPDSSPMVTLDLSHGGDAPTIVLTRNLLDDRGEWQEGSTVLKKKKQALDKIQEVLPITADAAALLLWGRQDDMPAVVDSFPSDGHSLLTAATIKGSGPDPKAIIKQLEKDSDQARKGERGGQVVGPLIQAKNALKLLVDEMEGAVRADEELRSRRQQLQEAKARRDQVRRQAEVAQARLDQFVRLEKLMVPALDYMATRDRMAAEQQEWKGLEEEIADARKDADGLHKELEVLVAQHRVARDEELGRQIEGLQERIRVAEELDTACADIVKDLKARKRPEPADVKTCQALQRQLNEAQAKMEATGVRYELSADAGPRTLRIAEDGQDAKEIVLAAGQSHQGIVGRLTIEADGLRFAAAGKEDISGLKETIQNVSAETRALFKRFAAETDAEFLDSAREQERLQQALEQTKNDMRRHLGAATISGLKTDLDRLAAGRIENNMTLKDREICAGKHLPSAADINSSCEYKRGEIQKAREAVRILEQKRPNEATRNLSVKTLEAIRTKAREAAATFADADEQQREPTRQLGDEIRVRLDRERQEQMKLSNTLIDAEKKVAELQGQLTQAQPHRALDEIRADL
ncbi:MAG: AAA family ATPase, partial [Gemmataceae bacterium]|nr:AAA family ATPase [Gemmataceae bacterium]